MTQVKKYPFKFLDAYSRDDRDIFFGREDEIEQLYQMVFQTDLILIYGASGTGKTSLIQCGLASKFQPYEWVALSIRRGENINLSLEKAIKQNENTDFSSGHTEGGNSDADDLDWLNETTTHTQQAQESMVAKSLKTLYLKHFKPIFLIFDQFEELYILGDKAEQDAFIETVREILRIEQPIKIIFSIREEYLGYLYNFERKVPELLRKKLRIESMNLEKVQSIVHGIGKLSQSNVRLRQGEEEAIGLGIFEKLKGRDNTRTIELPYLQVFLDDLYMKTTRDTTRQADAEFTLDGLGKMGDIGDVLRNFLEGQVQQNAVQLGTTTDNIKKLLAPFVTLDGTKAPLSVQMLRERLPDFSLDFITRSVEVFQKSRILRFDEKEQRYEIAHDSLARQIATYQDAEDIALQKSAQIIQTQVLMETEKREVFTEKQLLFIEPYLPKLSLKDEEKAWIAQSRHHWQAQKALEQEREQAELEQAKAQAELERSMRSQAEKAKEEADKNANRARQRTRIAAVLAVLALIVTFWAYQKQKEAEQSLVKFQIEERERKTLEAQKLIERAKAMRDAGYPQQFEADLDAAMQLDTSAQTKRDVEGLRKKNQ